MSEWKEYKLGDIAIFKNGKSRPAEEDDLNKRIKNNLSKINFKVDADVERN